MVKLHVTLPFIFYIFVQKSKRMENRKPNTFIELLNSIDKNAIIKYEDDYVRCIGCGNKTNNLHNIVVYDCWIFSKKQHKILNKNRVVLAPIASGLYTVTDNLLYGNNTYLIDKQGNIILKNKYRCIESEDTDKFLSIKLYMLCTDGYMSPAFYMWWDKSNNSFTIEEPIEVVTTIDNISFVGYLPNKGYNIFNKNGDCLSKKWFQYFYPTLEKKFFYYKGLWYYLAPNMKIVVTDYYTNETLNKVFDFKEKQKNYTPLVSKPSDCVIKRDYTDIYDYTNFWATEIDYI